jgi:predicted acylesterase/phospholipase RssA
MYLLLWVGLLVSYTSGAHPSQCRVLALSGGGMSGAWQAGVIKGLARTQPWDVVSGVSAGALNAFAVGLTGGSRILDLGDIITDMWLNHSMSDVCVKWPGGLIDGLLHRSGLYDTRPMRGTLLEVQTKLGGVFKDVHTIVTATRMSDNVPVQFVLNTGVDPVAAVMSSTASPLIFPPIELLDGRMFYDGGVSGGIEISSAVEWCKAQGWPESAIVVDTLECACRTRRRKQSTDPLV